MTATIGIEAEVGIVVVDEKKCYFELVNLSA
jgi:hypothetical protein